MESAALVRAGAGLANGAPAAASLEWRHQPHGEDILRALRGKRVQYSDHQPEHHNDSRSAAEHR
jgi:hypothetical protein